MNIRAWRQNKDLSSLFNTHQMREAIKKREANPLPKDEATESSVQSCRSHIWWNNPNITLPENRSPDTDSMTTSSYICCLMYIHDLSMADLNMLQSFLLYSFCLTVDTHNPVNTWNGSSCSIYCSLMTMPNGVFFLLQHNFHLIPISVLK